MSTACSLQLRGLGLGLRRLGLGLSNIRSPSIEIPPVRKGLEIRSQQWSQWHLDHVFVSFQKGCLGLWRGNPSGQPFPTIQP